MKYFTEYKLGNKNFNAYSKFKKSPYKKVKELAKKFKGKNLTVVHVNTAFNSGGPAEIFKSQIPLERSLGIDSRWLVMKGPAQYFDITKKIHNLLQGKKGDLTAEEKKTYLEYGKVAAVEMGKWLKTLHGRVILVIHDPQPLPMIDYFAGFPIISRIHVDLSTPNRNILKFLKPLILRADKIMVSDELFRLQFMEKSITTISCPAIDAFTSKNVPMNKSRYKKILQKIGIDPRRPLVTQVSRFDPWKDPWGVIKAYKMAKKHFPGLQLALAGLIVAEDDPEAKGIYHELQQKYGNGNGNKDIHLYGEKKPPGNISNDEFINALQSGSDVILQKSLKEGFGMTVTEALFKAKPVIAGNVGGIPRQIQHNKNGLLVQSIEECGNYIIKLLKNPKLGERLGKKAREKVEKEFLMPRLLADHFKIYSDLL